MARPLSRQFGARTRASGLVIRESSQRSANLELHFGPRKNEGMAEGQKREIDVVLGECGRISPQSELFQPNVDFRRRAARSFGLFSIFLVRFHGYRHPSPARSSTRPSPRSDRNLTHARSSSAAASRPNPTTSAARKAANFRVSLMARPCETQGSTKTRRKLPGLDPDQYRGKTT